MGLSKNNCELYYAYSPEHLGYLKKLCIVERIYNNKDFSSYNTTVALNYPFFSLPCIDRKLLLTKKSRWEKLVENKLNDWKIHKSNHSLIIDCLELFIPMLVLLSFGLVFKNK